MPKLAVTRSIEIDAPIEKVFTILNDFSTWRSWSPWLIMDPEAKVTVSSDNKYYEWEGPRSGSGNMKIVAEAENKSVSIDLMFLKPWKSKAKTYFYVTEKDNQTEVKWVMDSSLPFFMFWMKKMMQTYIGMDYDRGLRMLKELVEEGKVHSTLNFIGKESLPEQQFIGVRTSCSMSDMGKKMAEDLPRIHAFISQNDLQIAGMPFTQYHKWDMSNGRAEYTSAIPVASAPSNLPEGFYAGSIPATSAYTIEHVGPYHHLGNAWTTLYSMQRGKEIAVNKKIHPLETYQNDPGEVAPSEIVTRIHFPLK